MQPLTNKELTLKDMEAFIDAGWEEALMDSSGLHESNYPSPEIVVGKAMWEQYKNSVHYLMSELQRILDKGKQP